MTIVNLSEPENVHGVTLTNEIDPEVPPAIVVDALDRAGASLRDVLSNPAPTSDAKGFWGAFGCSCWRFDMSAATGTWLCRALAQRTDAVDRGPFAMPACNALAKNGRFGKRRDQLSRTSAADAHNLDLANQRE